MTLGYNYSRVKIKTRVWNIAKINNYNKIVNSVDCYINNIDNYYNNNSYNNKIRSDDNRDNNRDNSKLEFIGVSKVLNIILIAIKIIVII